MKTISTDWKEYQNEKDVLEDVDAYLEEEKKMIEAIKSNNEEMINSLSKEKIERGKKKLMGIFHIGKYIYLI